MDNSILNNVVYLHIDATSFDPLYSEIIRIDGVKVKEGIVEVFSTSLKNKVQDVKKLISFIEVLPIICEDASFTKRLLEKYISDIKNKVLDLRELCSILEPWRRDYRVISLIKEVTSIEFENINKAKNILYVLNAFLCRLWDKENLIMTSMKNGDGQSMYRNHCFLIIMNLIMLNIIKNKKLKLKILRREFLIMNLKSC